MKRPTAQHDGARMKCKGDTHSLSPSLSLIHTYMCLTVSRRSRDLRSLSRDRSVTFFEKISNCLKCPKNVIWQSAGGRVTSDHCRVTVQWLSSKNFLIAWNLQETLFDSRSTVAWPPTTVAWPFSDFFFRKISKSLETSKKRCLTVGRQSRDLRQLSRDRSVTFFQILPYCLKLPKNVVWQSADCRVTPDHCRVTVQWLFSKIFLIAWNVQKRCLTVGRRSSDLRLLSRDRSVTFSKFSPIAWNAKIGCLTVGRRSRDLRPLSRDRSVTFFKKFSKLLETSKKLCLTVGRRSRDLRSLSRDSSATFFQKISKSLERTKNVVWQSADVRVTSVHCRVIPATFLPCLFRTASHTLAYVVFLVTHSISTLVSNSKLLFVFI